MLSSSWDPLSPQGSYMRLKIDLVPRPGHRGLKLLEGRSRERTGVLTLLVYVVMVERLVQLHLPSVISRQPASHVMLVLCIWSSILHRWSEMDIRDDTSSRGGGGASAVGCWGAWPYTCQGMQYFSMKALLMGGQMSLIGVTAVGSSGLGIIKKGGLN